MSFITSSIVGYFLSTVQKYNRQNFEHNRLGPKLPNHKHAAVDFLYVASTGKNLIQMLGMYWNISFSQLALILTLV